MKRSVALGVVALLLAVGVAAAQSVWIDDAVPSGATLAGDGEGWNWVSNNPPPFSGTLAHQSALAGGLHQHYFYNATATLPVGVGDSLFVYVYLDPANPPREAMLQWNGSDGTWQHRAYWGARLISLGLDGTASQRYMGPLPPTGQWVRLTVPASQVGLEGSALNGIAFALYDGRATWDSAGKIASPQVVPTTTTLETSANPWLLGASVSLTATVSGLAPTGSVAFTEAGAALPGCGSVSLSGGRATCAVSALGVGAHSIVASYPGDGHNSGSASAALLQRIVPQGETNVALPSGSVPPPSASSVYTASGYDFGPAGITNDERAGVSWGEGGGWNDANANSFPDWAQVNFNGSQVIDRVVVYTVQDNYTAPIEPTDSTTFSLYGAIDFTVEASSGKGGGWITLATVTGNNLVKRAVTFPPYTTDRIRINITRTADGWSRLTEVEAYGKPAAGRQPTLTALSSSATSANLGAAVTLTATVVGGGPSVPTGSVAFWENGNGPLPGCGAVALSGGTATCRLPSLSVGAHSLVAQYGSDAGNAISWSSALLQRIVPPGETNVALASSGAVASASSTYNGGGGYDFGPGGITDGERAGVKWGYGGGWSSAAGGASPDWVQINFNGSKTIDRVIAYTVQDAYASPMEPTDNLSFSLYGIKDFSVRGWDGASWVTLGSVSGNSLVKRAVTFPAYTTDRIRIRITATADGYSRLTEVEAWGAAAGAAPTSTIVTSSANPSVAGAGVTFTATVTGSAPTGTVAFTADGTAISGCGAVALATSSGGGTATCGASGLSVGTHGIVATYGGDGSNTGSSGSLSQVVQAAAGLVGWWRFEEGSGATAGDASGYGNNGTLVNGPVWAAGEAGGGLAFNGSNSYVSVPYAPSLNATSALTLSAWVRTTSAARGDVVSRFDASPWPGYALVVSGNCGAGQAGLWVGDTVNAYVCSAATVHDGSWHMVTGTYDGTTVRVYVDGALSNSGARTNGLTNTTTGPTIGAYNAGGSMGGFFAGSIDGVRIYSRALSAVEVTALWTSEAPAGASFVNPSFEIPSLGSGYQYNPSAPGIGWTFSAGSGIQGNGSAWGAAAAPDGAQTAFLQSTGSISQAVTLSAGSYTLSFQAARRACCVVPYLQPIRVTVDGAQIGGLVSPASTSFGNVSIPFSVAASGSHTFAFAGTDASDKTTFIDRVALASDPRSPTTTTLTSSANPSAAGASVTFTATVAGAALAGTVAFTTDGSTIGGCDMAPLAVADFTGARMAVCVTSGLATGSHSIVATYSGDSANQPSSSPSLSQVVNGAATVPPPTALKAFSPASITTGMSSTLRITLNPKLLYVAGNADNTVLVVDTATSAVLATVPVGSAPYYTAVNAAGTRAYVTNYGSGTVSVLDTATNTVTATIGVGTQPTGIALNPAGNLAYVANFGSSTVSVINLLTGTVRATLPAGNPVNVALNPAGTRAYVSNINAATVSVFDTATGALLTTIPVGARPRAIAFSTAGSLAYVVNASANSLSVINTTSMSVVATVAVGAYPTGVALNPGGTRAYVANYSASSVSVLDTATNTVIATIPVGANPFGVAVHPSGSKVYVSGPTSITVIDPATNVVVGTLAAGQGSSIQANSIVAPFSGATAGAAFTDAYPAGLVNSAAASPITTCGGTVTAASGAASVSLSGATIPSNDSCTVTVNVTSTSAGTYVNSTGPISTASAGTGAAADGTLTVTGPATTTTALASSANPSTVGASVTFTATVAGLAPTGSVAFVSDGSPIGGCAAIGLPAGQASSKTAACTTTALPAGTHAIVASYGGDASNLGSTSPSFSETVILDHPPVIASVSPAAAQAYVGGTVSYSVVATDPDAGDWVNSVTLLGTGGPTPVGIHGPGQDSYIVAWTPAAAGDYNLTVQVVDSHGVSAAQAVSAHVVALPAGTVGDADAVCLGAGTSNVGTTAGSFAVSDSGAATYSIPIQVPPGTAGLQPSLALSYSSQGGDGLLGIGWSLAGLSAITHCPATEAQDGTRRGFNYDMSANDDAYCLDGQRLIPLGESFLSGGDPNYPYAIPTVHKIEYRTEIDSYAKIESYDDPNSVVVVGPYRFRATTRSGQILDFGSRWWILSGGWYQHAVQPQRVNSIKVWALDSVSDRAGNTMLVDYAGTNEHVLRVAQQPPPLAQSAKATESASSAPANGALTSGQPSAGHSTSGPEAAAASPKAVATNGVPLYQAYSASTTDHFYTTSTAQRDYAVSLGFVDQGIAAYVEATQVAGTLPFWRFYSGSQSDHFYTTSVSEYNYVVTHGYTYETVEGYVYGSQAAGTVPLYRLSWWNPSTNDLDHFYTTSDAARTSLVSQGWTYDTIAGYVWPQPAPNAAVFVSQSVPATMALGQSYPVSVTMRNTGSNTWTAAGAYRLGSQNPQDNLVWGLGRVAVPSNVPPGGTVTFAFNVTPSVLGSLNFQWRMVQDGVEWFGDFTPNVPITVGQVPQPIGSFPETEFWPTTIRYYSAHDVSTSYPGYNEVAFFVKPRSEVAAQDVQRFYDQGAGMSTLTQRLDAIRVTVDKSDATPGTRVRTYYLNYGVSPTSKRLQLQNVQEQADDGTVLPPTSFDWTSTGLNFQGPGSASALITINADAATKVKVADLNGDGRSDLIRYAGRGPGATNNWEVCLGPLDPGNCVTYSVDSYGDNGDVSRWQVGDIMGDGRAWLITYDDTQSFSPYWKVCRFNGSGFDPCQLWSGPILYRTNNEWNEFYWADFDGDGRMDIISFHYGVSGNPGANYWDVCLSTGSGFNCQRDVPTVLVTTSGNLRDRVLIADINGDGKADYLERKSQDGGEDQWMICTANFGPGVAGPGFNCASGFVHGLKGDFNHFVIMDMNGDGLADLITRVDPGPPGEPCTSNGDCWQVCLSMGDGAFEFYDPSVHWTSGGLLDGSGNPVDPYAAPRCRYWRGLNAPVDNVIFGDFNGDGRTDMAAWDWVNRWFTVCYSTGSGFSCQAAVNNFPIWSDGGAQHKADAIVTGDFNGDGKTDILIQNSHSNWAKGIGDAGFADELARVTTGLGATTEIAYAPITDPSVYAKGSVQPGDRELVIQSPLYVTQETRASNGIGGQFVSTYFYEGLKGRTDGRGIEGFFRRRMLDGNGILNEVESEQAFPKSGRPRRISKWAPVSGIRPDPASVLRTSPLDVPQPGVLVKVNESNQLWASVSYPVGGGYQGGTTAIPQPTAYTRYVNQVHLTQSVEQSFELDGSALPQTTTQVSSIDDFGNPGLATVSTFDAAEGGTYTKQTVNQYQPDNRANWIIGRLTRSSVTSRKPNGESATRTSSWTYGSSSTVPSRDHPSSGACWWGFVCSETIEPDAVNDAANFALWQQTSYLYDQYGNRMQASVSFHERGTGDLVTRTTQTSYLDGDGPSNNRGRFALVTTPPTVNGITLTETRQFDPRFGGVTLVNGPNGTSSTASYDAFGRKVCGTSFDGAGGSGHRLGQSETVVQPCTSPDGTYPGIDTSCQPGESYRVRSRSSGGAASYVFYDTLQRERRGFSKAFNNLTWAGVSTTYDALGRKVGLVKPAGSGTVATALAYDVLNRVVSETTTGNNGNIRSTMATTRYAGLTTQVTRTNPGGSGSQTVTRTVNSQGLTTRVTDAAGQPTAYVYDALGNMRQTAGPPTPGAPGGITVTMGYDLRGRKTSMSDPDMGSWQYAYSGAGDLVFQRDGKGQDTRLLYDLLGRLTERREYPGADLGTGTGVVVNGTTWTYDSCNTVATGNGLAGRGKLCRMETHAFFPYMESNLVHRQETAYDGAARAARTTTTLGSTVYVSGAQYDGNGRVSQLEYPSGLTVRQFYNDWNGQLASVTDASGNVYWQALSRYADGQVTSMQVGPHTTGKAYDPLGRVASIVTPGQQSATYAFDELGNLTRRFDPIAGQPDEAYGYDLVNRLVSAGGLTISYDAAGDITWRSDVGSYSYFAGTHRMALAGGSGQLYSYDANGNLSSGGGRTVTSTAFNMPQSITAGGNTVSFSYDGNHARIAEIGPTSGFTFFVGSQFYEEQFKPDGTLARRHYIATPEGVVAMVQQRAAGAAFTTSTRYWHRDHLGSVVAITNEQGQTVERAAFDVWGRRTTTFQQGGEPLEERGYTGHETLDEAAVAGIGLVHMNGRIFDPATGRFLSADPVIQDPWNAQSLNRYSYVLNNPLSFTDPTGFSWWTRWGRTALRAVAAIAVAIVTEGAASEWAAGEIYGSTLVGDVSAGYEFGEAAYAAESAVAGSGGAIGAFAGAASGFAAGGIQGGNLESALYGALSGGVMGSISGTYGNSWPLSRVAVQTAAGGALAYVHGDDWRRATAMSFAFSAFSYGNVALREATIESSTRFAGICPTDGGECVSNASGSSAGLLGDRFKAGGGRLNLERLCEGRLCYLDDGGQWIFVGTSAELRGALEQQSSWLGGVQGGQGEFFAKPYAPGGFLDRVVESFSGPHDFFNSRYWYNSEGNAINYQGMAKAFGEVLNAANVFVAAPFAAAINVPPSAYDALSIHPRGGK